MDLNIIIKRTDSWNNKVMIKQVKKMVFFIYQKNNLPKS